MKKWLNELNYSFYTIGFVRGGLDTILFNPKSKIEADFIKWKRIDNNGSWFADPFILDVTDDYIDVLVEEMPKHIHKGIITKLTIDRGSFEVLNKKVVLDLNHHLSFPCIVRKKDRLFICPENGKSGPLALYEFDNKRDSAEYKCDICDDICWDSALTDIFGEQYLFTATKDDYCLDIYKWENLKQKFVPYQQLLSECKDSRLAGMPFTYKGRTYYPAQLCDKYYGRGVVIKELLYDDGTFSVRPIRTLFSPHKTLKLGMHTMNEYKGVVVIDVRGSKHSFIGPIIYHVGNYILHLFGKEW